MHTRIGNLSHPAVLNFEHTRSSPGRHHCIIVLSKLSLVIEYVVIGPHWAWASPDLPTLMDSIIIVGQCVRQLYSFPVAASLWRCHSSTARKVLHCHGHNLASALPRAQRRAGRRIPRPRTRKRHQQTACRSSSRFGRQDCCYCGLSRLLCSGKFIVLGNAMARRVHKTRVQASEDDMVHRCCMAEENVIESLSDTSLMSSAALSSPAVVSGKDAGSKHFHLGGWSRERGRRV